MLPLIVLLPLAGVFGETKCDLGESRIAIVFENRWEYGVHVEDVKFAASNVLQFTVEQFLKSNYRKNTLAFIEYTTFPQDIYKPGDFFKLTDVKKRILVMQNPEQTTCYKHHKRSLDHAVKRLDGMPGTGKKVILYVGTALYYGGCPENPDIKAEELDDYVQWLKEEKAIEFVAIGLSPLTSARLSMWSDTRLVATGGWAIMDKSRDPSRAIDLLCELTGTATPKDYKPSYCESNPDDISAYPEDCDLAQTRIAIIFQNKHLGAANIGSMKDVVKNVVGIITNRTPARFNNLMVTAFDRYRIHLYEPGDDFNFTVVSKSIDRVIVGVLNDICHREAMDWAVEKLEGMPGTGPKVIVFLGNPVNYFHPFWATCRADIQRSELVDQHVWDLKMNKSIKFITVAVDSLASTQARLITWGDTRCHCDGSNLNGNAGIASRQVVKHLCELSKNARFLSKPVNHCDLLAQKNGLFRIFQKQPSLSPSRQEVVFPLEGKEEVEDPNATMDKVYFHHDKKKTDFICYRLRKNEWDKDLVTSHNERVSIYPIRGAKMTLSHKTEFIHIPNPDPIEAKNNKSLIKYACRDIGVVEHGPIVGLDGKEVPPEHNYPQPEPEQ